jgi:hypothetical protein
MNRRGKKSVEGFGGKEITQRTEIQMEEWDQNG